MELINFFIILASLITTIVWSVKKRFEIRTLKIDYINEETLGQPDEYRRKDLERQKLIFEDS